jgi:HAD superfamily hydrolase (TIGR01509 family)
MNVIIPIGGKGERFLAEGFPSPKHMIRVLDKPMIFYVLDMMDLKDSITIVYNRHLDSQQLFQNLIETKYRHVKLVPIDYQTEGAAETVLIGICESMNHKRTVLFDCDTFYVPDVIQKVRNHDGNGVVYFNQDPNENKACYSYIAMDNDFNVVKVREKERISNCANSGIYIFEDSCVLQKYIE